MSNINETVSISKTKKIVVCEYNLNSGLEDGKFFNFDMTYDNHLKVETNVEPKILIYYDGTIEYVFYDEKVDYAIPDFDYRFYPFDKHELRFNISSGIYDKLYIDKPKKEASKSGSGILFDEDGLVFTNYHVIQNASTIKIKIPSLNIEKNAIIKFKDQYNDLVILEIIDLFFKIYLFFNLFSLT